MRLIVALFIATLLAALLDYTVSAPSADVPALKVNEQSFLKYGVELKNPSAFEMGDTPDDEQGLGLDWLWQAFSKVLLFVLFGWAVAKLYLQFRVVIVIFLGFVIITIFLIDLSGIIEITFQPENFEKIFIFFRAVLMEMRLADFLAVLVGLWAGYAGSAPVFRQQNPVGRF